MATKIWAIVVVIFTTFLTSSAQILYKLASNTIQPDLMSILTNFYLLSGLVLYAVGGTLMILSFRGGEVSVLYPIIATSYIWVSFLSIFFLNEKMNFFKWVGILFIIGGIVSIGFGSRDRVPAGVM